MRGINISINNICNNNCSFCFQSNYNNINPSNISLEHYVKILNFLKNDISHISLLGGEPTLHPQICEIIDITKENNFSCLLITNLLIPDEEKLNQLIQKDIDMLVNANHESEKNKQLFEKNLKQCLLNSQKMTNISFCLTTDKNHNKRVIDYIEYLCKTYSKIKPLHFRISPATPHGDSFELYDFSNEYIIIDKILTAYNCLFCFDCTLTECELDFSLLKDFKSLDGYEETLMRLQIPCQGALDILLGDRLFFCNSLSQFHVNLFDYDNFNDAYADLVFTISQHLKNRDKCQTCDNFKYCKKLCPAKNYNLL